MDRGEELYQAGIKAYKKGDFSEALKKFKKCLHEEPLHSKAIYYIKQTQEKIRMEASNERLSSRAQKLFSQQQYQETMIALLTIIESDANNEFAKSFLEKVKEVFHENQGNLTEENKENEFFKEGLKEFKQKNYKQAAVYWEVTLIINPQNEQSRQGLNKTRTAMIQAKEDNAQLTQEKINNLLQDGLELYGSGKVLKALEKWKEILELELDNKDALDYIVVAKADLNDDDYKSLRGEGGRVSDASSVDPLEATNTITVDQSELSKDIKEIENLLLDDEPIDELSDTSPIKTEAVEDNFELEDEELEIEEEVALDMEMEEDAIELEDDNLSFEGEEDLSMSEADENVGDNDEIEDLAIDENLDLDDSIVKPSFEESVSAAPENEDNDNRLDKEYLDDFAEEDEFDDEYELDEEFVEEEEEEEALVAEYDAAREGEDDAEAKKNLVEKYFNRGLTLYKKRNYEEAIIEWKKIFDLDKGNEKAKEYIEKAITLYEASPFIEEHLRKGKDFFDEKNYEEAIKEYEKILEIDPELDEALSAIDKAKIKLTEVIVPARTSQVSSDKSEGKKPSAKKKAFGIDSLKQPKMLAGIGAAVLIFIFLVSYFFVIAPNQERKKIEKAKEAKQHAIQKLNDLIKSSTMDAELSLKLNKFSLARDAWNKVLALAPDNKKAKHGIEIANKLEKTFNKLRKGDALLKKRKYDEAILTYKNALADRPDDKLIKDKIKESEKSRRIYLDQKSKVNELLAKGKKQFDLKKYNLAIQIYRRAIKILPDDLDTKQHIRQAEFERRRGITVQANFKMGLSRYESRKYEDAKKFFQKVIELDPNNHEAKFYLDKIKEDESID